MYTGRQRRRAFLISVFFLAAILFSAFFLAREADHACAGEDCPICVALHQAERTLGQQGGQTESAPVFPALFLFFVPAFAASVLFLAAGSPVSRKVRMNH